MLALALVIWIGTRRSTATAAGAPEIALPDAAFDDLVVAIHDHRGQDDVSPPPPHVVTTPVDAALVDPAPKHPTAVRPTPAEPSLASISAADVGRLYGAVGRELKALETAKGDEKTFDLWPRYRWIRINEWLGTQEQRTSVATQLHQLRRDVAARR